MLSEDKYLNFEIAQQLSDSAQWMSHNQQEKLLIPLKKVGADIAVATSGGRREEGVT